MTMLWGVAGYAALIAGAAALLHRLRPGWRCRTVALSSALPGPVIVLLLTGILVARLMLDTPQPGETDASGMALMIYTVGGGLLAAMLLPIGLGASLLAWRVTRRNR